ncbi:MAG: SIR2 family protein, partial [Candidatus Lokiarchaeota archaeon]|nr:SIR2 family protein [Candidatus Lokiarchaeota archaeon]
MLEPADIDLVEMLGGKEPLCFLVGAGISMDPPAGLGSARQLMEAIINFGAPERFISRLAAIPDLRYELLIQQFRTFIDKDLTITRYFDEVSLGKDSAPNQVHGYLASMLLAGHPVMTTNFDHFIERAAGLQEPRLRVVITAADFDRFGDPRKNAREGLAVLYKLHGSPRNAITGEDTSSTVITTIDALGKKKEGDFFSVEVFKRPLFDHICEGRVLVVMGYSGGDDFDVVPMLNRLKGARAVVWVVHTSEPGGQPGRLPAATSGAAYRAFKIIAGGRGTPVASIAGRGPSPLDETLVAIARRLSIDVFKVEAHTGKLISAVPHVPPAEGILADSPPPRIADWLASNLHPPPPEVRASFASGLFQVMELPLDAIEASEEALEACTAKGDERG